MMKGMKGAMLRAEKVPSIGEGYSLLRISSRRYRLGCSFDSPVGLKHDTKY